MIIQVSPLTLATEMKRRGFNSIDSEWTNTLMNVLEDIYGIEAEVVRMLEKLGKEKNANGRPGNNDHQTSGSIPETA